MHKKIVQSTSHYWNGFIGVLAWISRVLLGWRAGDGESIKLGIDLIAGMNMSYILSPKLLSYLNDYGICTLNQDRNTCEGTTTQSYWLSVDNLEP